MGRGSDLDSFCSDAVRVREGGWAERRQQWKQKEIFGDDGCGPMEARG